MADNNEKEGLVQIAEAFKTKVAETDSAIKTASEAIQNNEKGVAEALSRADKAAEEVKTLSARLRDIELEVEERVAKGTTSPVNPLRETLTSPEFDAYRRKSADRFAFEFKTISSVDSAKNPDHVLIAPDRLPGIRTPADPPLNIENVIPAATTTSDSVQFTREASARTGASPKTQGQRSTESTSTFELGTVPIRDIYTHYQVPETVLADTAQIESYIEGRLSHFVNKAACAQILRGSGADNSGQLSGITLAANTTAYTPLNNAAATEFDNLNNAISQLQRAGYSPSAIVLDPQDWWALNRLKDDNGNYILGGPEDIANPRLWGIPVALEVDPALTGKFYLADFRYHSQVWNRQGVQIEMSRSDGNNFQTLTATIRAARRLAVATYIPQASLFGLLKKA